MEPRIRPSERRSSCSLPRAPPARRPVPIGDDTPRELVDDLDAAVADDVVHVDGEDASVQGAVHFGEELEVGGLVKAATAEHSLHVLDAGLGEARCRVMLIGIEVESMRERRDKRRQLRRPRRAGIEHSGDHQRHTASSIISESASSSAK